MSHQAGQIFNDELESTSLPQTKREGEKVKGPEILQAISTKELI